MVPVARLLAKSFLGDSGITTAFIKRSLAPEAL